MGEFGGGDGEARDDDESGGNSVSRIRGGGAGRKSRSPSTPFKAVDAAGLAEEAS
ncbi:hypothetical protein QJS04_geneDACA000660 [Acorus gramineus]|uniref:Uncharacterized protein n=1 Tax=Acorus gramineus TaxID=55184 RepID=A0AAV9AU21_ACOGR|nr:hypothetical protein QJS04_geneDACA000660 [Acorus gramineus]